MNASAAVATVSLGSRIRAAIESALPWFDREGVDRTHRTTRILVDRAQAVIDRREVMRGSYRRAGERIGGR